MKKTPSLDTPGYETVALGLAQIHTEKGDVEGNFVRLCEAIKEGARKGAELLVTPETVIQGYPDVVSAEDRKTVYKMADSPDGPRLQKLRQLCAEHELELIVGFVEKDNVPGRFYNSAAHISASGDIRYVYRKVHCRPFESAEQDGGYTPGSKFHSTRVGFQSGEFTIGTMICFDREVTEATRCLRQLGAHLVACPLACDTDPMTGSVTHADAGIITRVRAVENEVFIAVVNHAGRFNGGSFVVGPGGELIEQLGVESETRVIRIPIGVVPRAFHIEPLGWQGWGFRRPELYREYLGGDQ